MLKILKRWAVIDNRTAETAWYDVLVARDARGRCAVYRYKRCRGEATCRRMFAGRTERIQDVLPVARMYLTHIEKAGCFVRPIPMRVAA